MGFQFPFWKRRLMRSASSRHFAHHVAVARNGSAAGRANLDKGELVLVGRTVFEKALDGAKTLRNSLGVIDAVHADTHVGGLHAKIPEQCRALQVREILRRLGLIVAVERNADGKRPHQRGMPVPHHRKVFPIDARFQRAIHGIQKIVAVPLDMETDQIGPQQAFQQFALPRANSEGLRIRPRNVPENSDTGVRAMPFDDLREQGKMIILDQHDGAFLVGDFLEDGGGEFLVNRAIRIPIAGAKLGAGMRNVAQRP